MNESIQIDPLHFRTVLGHLPTGVTVITAHGQGGPTGMAANSVTSVSLEPPLVLFCPARSSTTWPLIQETGAFCLNVMASDHEDLIRRFSTKDTDRFASVEWARRETGPALSGAVAWIECQIQNEYEAGDHLVVIAGVTAVEARSEVEPLVFFRGSYGSFRTAEPS
jgi:3-hydroxy-9,10-secoandrosta-1,3,5(10)-triene-9,17-dione monooxygenase reductase component